jgi:hypothetical protein
MLGWGTIILEERFGALGDTGSLAELFPGQQMYN